MKTNIIAYEQKFIDNCNTGYGCGYVHIPKNHPILVMLLEESNYITVEGFSDDITFNEWDKDKEFYVVGFDTAHSWNNMQNSGLDFVQKTTDELKKCIENFTKEDAKKYATSKVMEVTNLYKDYL